jgi:hypothetical protein
MGKDSIRLLVAINKRLNFQTQRDSKIQDEIGGNSLGNRCRRVPGRSAFSRFRWFHAKCVHDCVHDRVLRITLCQNKELSN